MFRHRLLQFSKQISVSSHWINARTFATSPNPSDEYQAFENAVQNIGGLTQQQRKQFQQFCQCILASQRHKLNVNELEDDYFKPSLLPNIPEDFPILNVTAIRNPQLIFARHLADALSLIPTIEKLIPELQSTVNSTQLNIVDIGSGGGLPGLAIAIARPDWRITTIDSVTKKCVFMKHVVDYIGLHNAQVFAGRAEDLAVPLHFSTPLTVSHPYELPSQGLLTPQPQLLFEAFDVCVARGVTSLDTLSTFCLPFVRPGGRFVAQKSAQIKSVVDDGSHGDTTTTTSHTSVGNSSVGRDGSIPSDNKGEQVRRQSRQHALNSDFMDTVKQLAQAEWNSNCQYDDRFGVINHEIDVRCLIH